MLLCEICFWLSECISEPDRVPAFRDLPFQRRMMLHKYTDSNTSTRYFHVQRSPMEIDEGNVVEWVERVSL